MVSKATFDERIGKATEARKAAEEKAAKLQDLADRAAPLAAKASGFDSDPDTLETLQLRYERAAKNGYAADFSDWLADADGAGKDSVASRFRSSSPAPKAEPAKSEAPKADPPSPAPKSSVPSTPTAAPASAPTPRLTESQVQEINSKLMAEYRGATPERRSAIKVEMEANRNKLASLA